MDSRPIGVFDSGIGGLTVVSAIRKELPNESIIYIGDTARVPYGIRSQETITKFASEIARLLLKKKVKVLVVACNTISAVSLPEIVRLSRVPVVGVIEPTVEKAVKTTKTKKIAIIGTTATIRSGIYRDMIKKADPVIEVFSIPTPLFVPIVEEGLSDDPVAKLMVEKYLQPIKVSSGIDTLVLGCTHYPLLETQMGKYLGPRIKLIDSAAPTAEKLADLLYEKRLAAGKHQATEMFFTSDDPEKSAKIAREFLGEPVELKKVDIGK